MPTLGIDASRAVKKEKTGVEWYSYFLLRAMEKCTPEGWKVRLYTPLPPSPDLALAQSPSPIGRGEGEGNWEWRPLKWIGRGWTQARLSAEMMAHPPDVLFVPSHTIPLVHPERTVTTVHDVVFLKYPELYDPEDLENQKRGLDFALKFAKRIIVPTRAVREDLLAAGAGEGQVTVIPHGVEFGHPEALAEGSLTNVSNAHTREILRFAQNDIVGPYILFIGRIEKKKNVLGLVQAFRKLIAKPPLNLPLGKGEKEGVRLVFAGPLGFGGKDVLQAIRTFKLEDRVVHLGYVSRPVYAGLLQNAAMLVLPSFGEGFGLPVLEAMTAGTPVACSDVPVLREVGGNAAQYFNPNDPQNIARVIETVLDNEMLQAEMVRRGKERAREFTWQRSAKETWEVICNTIGR